MEVTTWDASAQTYNAVRSPWVSLPRKFDPHYAMLKGAHMGLHQHRPSVSDVSQVPREGDSLICPTPPERDRRARRRGAVPMVAEDQTRRFRSGSPGRREVRRNLLTHFG